VAAGVVCLVVVFLVIFYSERKFLVKHFGLAVNSKIVRPRMLLG